MFRLICSGVVLLLLLTGCSSESPTRPNDFTPLTSIQIVPADQAIAASRSIAAHTSTKLTVIGDYSGLFPRDITDQAVWSSDAPAVAAFVTPGFPSRVTGLAPGSAVLTATVGGVSTTFTLTVTSATATALTVTPAAQTLPKGLTAQFAATGTFSDGTTQDITFDADWGSSAPGVATVGNVAGSKGLAQGVAAGTATIGATFGAASNTALLTVTEVVLQSIAVAPANPSILSLSTGKFTATGTYSDGTTADITGQATWSSSQPGFATIAAGGAATTVAPGTTSISATLNGVTGATNLKVTGGSLTGITVKLATPRLVKGTVAPISAIGSFNNGSSRDITGAVGWSVANTTVASVSTPGGNVAFLSADAASPAPTTVKAAFGTVIATTNLTVAAPLVQSLAISPASLDLAAGSTGRLTATATFSDGTTQDVTDSADWSSNAAATATVDNTGLAKGRVHGVAAGLTTISASFGGRTVTTPATVTVRTRTLATLTVTNFPALTVGPGNQVSFTATATYADGTTQDVTEATTWTLGNPNVAILADSVNQPGQIVGVDAGSTPLTASFGGKTQTVTITVP